MSRQRDTNPDQPVGLYGSASHTVSPGALTPSEGGKRGDTAIDSARYIPSWFRVWRASPATFVVTCGVGETLGFRDWEEVVYANETGRFGANTTQAKELFEYYQHHEHRMWYLVEWSAHVSGGAVYIPYTSAADEIDDPNDWGERIESYAQRSLNYSSDSPHPAWARSQGKLVNPVGTIRMIQRLHHKPRYW